MRFGTPRFALLGMIAGLMGRHGTPDPTIEPLTAPDMPKMNRQGGGHPGSKPHSDSTYRIRARKRWLKRRKRNSRRGIYTVRGCRA